jgi:hypothetical protein
MITVQYAVTSSIIVPQSLIIRQCAAKSWLPGGGRRISQSGRGLFNGMACPAAGNFTLFR